MPSPFSLRTVEPLAGHRLARLLRAMRLTTPSAGDHRIRADRTSGARLDAPPLS